MQPPTTITQEKLPTFSRRGARNLSLLCALSLVMGAVSWSHAAQPPAATSPVTAPVTEHQFAKSVFVNTPGMGKDPFFPTSKRRGEVKTTAVIEGPTVPQLTLKGISGPKNHRLAIINNKTFEVGEESDLRLGSQIVRVKCVEVRDDGVTVSINGQTQKLSLIPKL